MTQALTIGEIARRLGWPNHRVDYFIRSRGMKPTMRAGNLRVFPASIIDRLRAERAAQIQPHLQEIQA